ncbi:unnamed protein product [Phytomonas sp. Hart1]|nr:unnamed protein product [Phytomonas sp. Hart1]|eukprot:CCW67711.1 unnamed protein product [Phytomonas sp. isolate Hart1]
MPFGYTTDSDALDLFSGGHPSTLSPFPRNTESMNLHRMAISSLLFPHKDLPPPLDPVAILVDSHKCFSVQKENSSAGESASTCSGDQASKTYNETDGLSLFFNGMAAGEDMSTLISILSQTLQRARRTATWPTSPLLNYTHSEKRGNVDAGKPRFLGDVEKKNSEGSLQLESPFLNTSLSGLLSSTPSSLISQREWIKEATRAAVLFSVESLATSDAVSLFYYSSCFTERLRLKGAIKSAGDRKRESDLFFFRHPNEVLRPLLSDRVVVALARQLLRDCHHSTNPGQLDEVERVLEQIDPTPAIDAVLIDLYSRKGKWERALNSLHHIPQSLWTEFDITGVIRSFYRAALRNDVPSSSEAFLKGLNLLSPGRVEEGCMNLSSVSKEGESRTEPEVEFFTYPLHLIKQAMGCKVSWSTPSAVNDALGLLSMKPNLWREACMFLDTTVLSPHCVGEPKVCMEKNESIDKAFVCTNADSLDGSVEEEVESSADATSSFVLDHDSSFCHMRPNAVTVYQTCRVLCQSPETAFSYAKALLDRFDIPIITDFKATEQYLSFCAHSGRWQEALCIMKKHRQQLEKERHRNTIAGQRGASYASLAGCTVSDRMHSSNDKSFNFNQLCVHYSPNVYLALVELFSKSRCTEGVDALLQQKSLSKFYNPQTLSRAYNALIQTSKSVDEAMRYCDRLTCSLRQRSHKRSPGKENLQYDASADPRHQRTQTEEPGISINQETLEALENESLHQLTILNAMEGSWKEAVTIFQHLLHDPRRKLYVPTTEVHDCVQYALAQAPAPGASWHLSVSLFFELCKERELSTSPLAFQSTVKKCSSQGAGEVVQTLFKFLIRKGV